MRKFISSIFIIIISAFFVSCSYLSDIKKTPTFSETSTVCIPNQLSEQQERQSIKTRFLRKNPEQAPEQKFVNLMREARQERQRGELQSAWRHLELALEYGTSKTEIQEAKDLLREVRSEWSQKQIASRNPQVLGDTKTEGRNYSDTSSVSSFSPYLYGGMSFWQEADIRFEYGLLEFSGEADVSYETFRRMRKLEYEVEWLQNELFWLK